MSKGPYDHLAPPQSPHAASTHTAGSMTTGSTTTGSMTTGVRTRASKVWNATTGTPAASQTQGGVAMQAVVPHPATHMAIAKAQNAPAAVADRAQQRAALANVQAALGGHGLPVTVNGELDFATRAALKSFQSTHGLPATGTVDAHTHAAVLGAHAAGVDDPSTGKRAGRNGHEESGQGAMLGAIQHSSPKGSPVVRIARTAPVSPARVPPAGTPHPSQPGPPGLKVGVPPRRSIPVTFKNSTKPGQSSSSSAQHAGPTTPPQGAGSVAGGTQSSLGYTGGWDTPAGRIAGLRPGERRAPGASSGKQASAGEMVSGARTGASTMANKGNTKNWRSTGWRICLLLTASIAGAGNASISVNPQMDFRGENLVIDTTTVGPSSTLTIPSIGTIPQIAGGTASTAVPGTLFSPAQAGALDFKMSIANQGNAVQFTANNTNTSVTLAFAALLFGCEVESYDGSMTTGVAPAGSYHGG